MTPSSARAKAEPITGWPANGISLPARPKMRRRRSVPAASAGSANVHSEKFISRVIADMASVARPCGSMNTASWLPVCGRSVKTS